MIPLPLAWTLLTVSFWTCGSGQILMQESVAVLYPELHGDESIDCNCFNISCVSVYWFRSLLNTSKLELIGKLNNADRSAYGDVDKTKFKFSRRGMSFLLRVSKLTEADTGIYSCVLKDKSSNEIWKPGTLLRPGVTPPTVPPVVKVKRPKKPICRCYGNNNPKDGCGSLILWPLVGLTGGLFLAVVCTLYYFSRLPKKCQHHFVKKRLMN